MTRESRMLLVIGLLAVLGVTSLALMADRYRRVLTEPPAPSKPLESRRIDVPLPPPSPSSPDAVGRFAAVRGEVKKTLEENLATIEAATEPATGRPREAAVGEVIAEVRDRKREMLRRVGLPEPQYDRIRSAYRSWLAGGAGVDEGLRRAFEARREQLEALDLETLESLDVSVSP